MPGFYRTTPRMAGSAPGADPSGRRRASGTGSTVAPGRSRASMRGRVVGILSDEAGAPPMDQRAIQETFAAALDALIADVRRDRSVLAAILCGSLSHDTV